jgi:aspartyl protease
MLGRGRFTGLLATTALTLSFAGSVRSAAPDVPLGTPRYQIKLGPFVVPPTRAVGLVIGARINGGPRLRLLLDSGAQNIVLDRRAAEKSGCSGGSDLDLVGAGVSIATVVKMRRAETVQVGDLTLRDVPLLIEDRSLADGIQGAMPLSVFAGFLIRLNIPEKSLDLLPYPPETAEPAGALRSVASNQLLFVKGTANERSEGYFLLDTGASYTAISRNLIRELRIPESMADRVPLQAGTAALDAPVLRGSVRLQFGSLKLETDPVVAVDLSASSRYHRLEISGLIGYPALRDSILTVSYRDKFIRITPR